MKTSLSSRFAVLLTVVFAFAATLPATACPACYGDTTGSKMGNAATWGIAAMVVIMLAMLGTLVGCGFYLAYRAKHPLPDYEELLAEDDGQIKPEPNA
jgi:hypothetical protein